MPDLPRLMTTQQAADKLGLNPETIRRAIRAGRLACYRMGGATRIAPEHLAAYLASSLCPVRDVACENEHSSAEVAFADQMRRARRIQRALSLRVE